MPQARRSPFSRHHLKNRRGKRNDKTNEEHKIGDARTRKSRNRETVPERLIEKTTQWKPKPNPNSNEKLQLRNRNGTIKRKTTL